MKKSLRLSLTLAAVMLVGTMPVFATVSGTNPPPGSGTPTPTFSVAVNVVLTVLGF